MGERRVTGKNVRTVSSTCEAVVQVKKEDDRMVRAKAVKMMRTDEEEN